MTPFTIGLIGLVAMIVFLFSGMPVGLVMGLLGFAGFSYVKDLSTGLAMLGSVPYSTFASYGFSVFPLFVLMGEFCYFANISKELYYAAYKWIGHRPGGLAMASIAGCAGFATVSGSGVATAATMATVALPEMKKRRYDPALATGCLSTGGTLGTMIPPSVGFVIYGIIAEQSIGKLFVAGIFPGIMLALLYITVVYVVCKRNPLAGLPGPKASWKERFSSLKGTWIVLLLFALVMGGIYLGFFSPTEAAGVGACGAFLFAAATRRLTWHAFRQSINTTMKNTAMGFLILCGAMIFTYFLAVTRMPDDLARWLTAINLSRYYFIAAIVIIYVILGTALDGISMTVLTVPIFLPVVSAYGFDLIWFGVIVVLMAEIASISPPVGMCIYIIQALAEDVPMNTVFRGTYNFMVAQVVGAALLVAFPIIATYLPSTMFNPLK